MELRARQAQAGVRGLGDLDASTDDDSEDGERGNELYTGGAKRCCLMFHTDLANCSRNVSTGCGETTGALSLFTACRTPDWLVANGHPWFVRIFIDRKVLICLLMCWKGPSQGLLCSAAIDLAGHAPLSLQESFLLLVCAVSRVSLSVAVRLDPTAAFCESTLISTIVQTSVLCGVCSGQVVRAPKKDKDKDKVRHFLTYSAPNEDTTGLTPLFGSCPPFLCCVNSGPRAW